MEGPIRREMMREYAIFFELSPETQEKIEKQVLNVTALTGLDMIDALELVMKTWRHVIKNPGVVV
jgi:hypothetical protein